LGLTHHARTSGGEYPTAARADVAGEDGVDDEGFGAARRRDVERLSGLEGGQPFVDLGQSNPELQLLDADDRSAKADASALEARTDADLILDTEIVDGALIGRFALCHWDRPGVGALVVQATGP
jgi:hypothetical protein